MKYLLLLILILPFATAYYGGETFLVTTIKECDNMTITVYGHQNVTDDEYILENCLKLQNNQWYCDCNESFPVIMSTKPAAVNDYYLVINYSYSQLVSEQQPSGGGGGGSRKTTTACVPNWKCTYWTGCKGDKQTRKCIDLSGCEDERKESRQCKEIILEDVIYPNETRFITKENSTTIHVRQDSIFSANVVMAFVAVIMLIAAIGYYIFRRR